MAKLPVIWPDFGKQRFDCHGCTRCCRDLVVHLTGNDRRRIDRQEWAGRIEGEPYVRLGRSHVLNHAADGACVFLQEDGRCRIHAEHGPRAKPLACQIYPFTLERDGGAVRAAIRFDCPSVAGNRGSLLTRHRAEVERLASIWQSSVSPAERSARASIRLVGRRVLGEDELSALLKHLDRWLRDTSISLNDRLTGLVGLLDTLGAAKLDGLTDDRLDELIGMLIDELPPAIRRRRDNPPANPTVRQHRLMRQAVFAYSEHVTFEQARATVARRWAGRVDQLRRGRRIASGQGPLPPLAGQAARGTFEDLAKCDRHDGFDAAECDQTLTRYVRARLTSRSAFGPAYYDWPVVDGLRAMILSIVVIGWLSRYLAVADGRSSYSEEDVATALSMVDRNAGRAPALGRSAARLGLRYLGQDDALPRLLNAYRIGD